MGTVELPVKNDTKPSSMDWVHIASVLFLLGIGAALVYFVQEAENKTKVLSPEKVVNAAKESSCVKVGIQTVLKENQPLTGEGLSGIQDGCGTQAQVEREAKVKSIAAEQQRRALQAIN